MPLRKAALFLLPVLTNTARTSLHTEIAAETTGGDDPCVWKVRYGERNDEGEETGALYLRVFCFEAVKEGRLLQPSLLKAPGDPDEYLPIDINHEVKRGWQLIRSNPIRLVDSYYADDTRSGSYVGRTFKFKGTKSSNDEPFEISVDIKGPVSDGTGEDDQHSNLPCEVKAEPVDFNEQLPGKEATLEKGFQVAVTCKETVEGLELRPAHPVNPNFAPLTYTELGPGQVVRKIFNKKALTDYTFVVTAFKERIEGSVLAVGTEKVPEPPAVEKDDEDKSSELNSQQEGPQETLTDGELPCSVQVDDLDSDEGGQFQFSVTCKKAITDVVFRLPDPFSDARLDRLEEGTSNMGFAIPKKALKPNTKHTVELIGTVDEQKLSTTVTLPEVTSVEKETVADNSHSEDKNEEEDISGELPCTLTKGPEVNFAGGEAGYQLEVSCTKAISDPYLRMPAGYQKKRFNTFEANMAYNIMGQTHASWEEWKGEKLALEIKGKGDDGSFKMVSNELEI